MMSLSIDGTDSNSKLGLSSPLVTGIIYTWYAFLVWDGKLNLLPQQAAKLCTKSNEKIENEYYSGR